MALLSIPESICPHRLQLVGLVQQVARLVHPKSGPAFPSCPSGAKGLPAEASACVQRGHHPWDVT